MKPLLLAIIVLGILTPMAFNINYIRQGRCVLGASGLAVNMFAAGWLGGVLWGRRRMDYQETQE